MTATTETRPRPSIGKALAAEYVLLVRSIATRGRLVAIGSLAIVSVLLAVVVRSSTPDDLLVAAVGYANANIGTLIPIAALVFGAAALGDLIDDGSIVYLWLRPLPTWVHVVAAWAATVSVALPVVALPVVAATPLIDPSAEAVGSAALAAVVGVVAYSALFVLAGVRFRRALPWGIVYILIWEGFVAHAGETATKLAVRSYLRSILSSITDVEIDLGIFGLAVGIVVPLLVSVAALAYGSRRLANTDIP